MQLKKLKTKTVGNEQVNMDHWQYIKRMRTHIKLGLMAAIKSGHKPLKHTITVIMFYQTLYF